MPKSGGTYTFTIKPITDLSDIKTNIGTIQKVFNTLKLPDKITDRLSTEIEKFDKAYSTVQKKMAEGVKTPGDLTQLQKNNNLILSSWTEISKIIKEVSGMDLRDILTFDTQSIQEAKKQLADLETQLNNITLNKTQTNQLEKAINNVQSQTKSAKVQDLTKGMLEGLEEKKFSKVFENYNKLKQHHNEFINMFGSKTTDAINKLGTTLENTTGHTGNLTQQINETRQEVERLENAEIQAAQVQLESVVGGYNEQSSAIKGVTQNIEEANKAELEFNKNVSRIESQIESYFGLNAIFRTVANMAREAMQTVKELDAAMTETAVVTNFSVGDMWEKLPLYTAEANKLGSSIKDVYEATTLYYQQGLNTTQSMGLAVETLKMARIAGMDAKDATDAMTAALRGFNLELNQTSAQRINDVYSELAAITASDTQEISTAMEKVASLAHNAGMELETTSAFLAQMIETTREAPENLGTALKTVIARFQEMKQDPTQLVDSEGVAMDANKVDKALKSIGVNLLDVNGEFRKLDDVFLEIAAKWDTLTVGQQRYIATIAAGSRQQSRFIAMMSDYSRTMELVDAAYDASGASQRQFEKTLESMEAKLNKLKNAWDQFIMGLMNNELLKGIVDAGTGFLTVVNNIIDGIASITGPAKGLTKTLLTLVATFGGLTAAKGILKSGVSIGAKWFGGEQLQSKVRDTLGMPDVDVTKSAHKAASSWRQIVQQDLNSSPLVLNPQQIGPNPPTYKQGLEVSRSRYQEAYITNAQKAISEQYSNVVSSTFRYKAKNGTAEELKEYMKGFPKVTADANKFGTAMNSAGYTLQTFGGLLQSTPLAPFGKAVSAVGGTLTQVATVAATGVKTATGNIVFGFTAVKTAAASAISALLPFIAIAGAIAAVGYLLYDEFTRDKREMEALAEAANTASDTYDNLKTATEDLKNSIEDIRNIDSTFDGLVVGTTEWNQALVEANQQVLDLIQKYDILRDYTTTDSQGLMHISEAGFKAVQEEQAKALGQAQALDILSNSEYNNALLKQEQKQLLKNSGISAYQTGLQLSKGGRDSEEWIYDYEKTLENGYKALNQSEQEKWNNIQAKIDANKAASDKEAVRAALVIQGKLNETVLNTLANNIDTVSESFKNETDISKIKQVYADFTGGIFDAATGVITDISGEEVDIDDSTLKQYYPRMMALLQFQDQAPQIESAIQSVGRAFDNLITDDSYSNLFSDILNNNVEVDIDALNKFLNTNTKDIVDALNNLTDEQAATILQQEGATVSDLINYTKDQATKLRTTQAQTFQQTATWYARYIKKMNANIASPNVIKAITTKVMSSVNGATAVAINKSFSQISQTKNSDLIEGFNSRLNEIFFESQDTEMQSIMTDLLDAIDWSSAIKRGKLYQDVLLKTEDGTYQYNKAVRKQVKELQNVDKQVDITALQFEELIESADFLEIQENMKDFVDESGKITPDKIYEMAEQCGTLADMLELDEFNASNLATALNYFNQIGTFDGLTGAVIAAAKEFNSLDNLIDDVKKNVESFEPGEDYNQGIKAYRGYATSLKERYEAGMYSSADTLSYAQRFIDSDKWEKYVKSHGKSNKSAEKALIDDLNTLLVEDEADTTLNLLTRMAQKQNMFGDTIEKVSDKFEIGYDKEGRLRLDIDKDTTRKDFITDLVDIYGFSEEFAKVFTLSLEGQDLGFIDDNLTQAFNEAGRKSGIEEFGKGLEARGVDLDRYKTDATNNLILTQAEVDALRELGGYASDKKLFEDFEEQLGIAADKIKVFNTETDTSTDYLKQYYAGTDQSKLSTKRQAQNFLGSQYDGTADFDKGLKELKESGIEDTNTALQLLVDMAHEAGAEFATFKGETVEVTDVFNSDEFQEAFDIQADETKWIDVGNTIGERIVEYLSGTGYFDNKANGSNNSDQTNKVMTSEEIVEKTTLELDKSKAEKGLQETNKQIQKLEADIERRKELNLDTSNLEDRLAVAKAKAIAFEREIDKINTKLNQINDKDISISFSYNQSGPTVEPMAKGHNNHISSFGFYPGGSAANGIKGRLGPKGKGGLTLTGEEGFEVAWLPSEGRSMILGAHGPQMTNLPSDAVVWNHKQSKKIIAQKGISLGSMGDGNTKGGTYDLPSNNVVDVNIVKDSTKTSSSNKKSDASSSKHTDWQAVEIDRYNYNQKINKITKEIEDTSKEIDKSLERVGTTYKDIAKDVQNERKLIERNIAYQTDLQKTYEKGLRNLTNKRTLHVSLEGKKTDTKINTKDFIKEVNGVYTIDRAAIEKKYKKRVDQETVFNALQSEIDKLTSGADNAAKAIADLENQNEELTQKLTETFLLWDNELTKTYQLTQKLEQLSAERSRYDAEVALQTARLNVGTLGLSKGIALLNDFRVLELQNIQETVEVQKKSIQSQKKDLTNLLDFTGQISNYEKIENNKKSTPEEKLAAETRRQALEVADKYISSTKNADGTYDITIDYSKLEKDRKAEKLTADTYEEIKKVFDEANSANIELNNSIASLAETLTEPYEQLRDYQETLAALEEDLLKAIEDAAQREIDKMSALNTSLTNSFKTVIDQVKKNIDARRQLENNAKTESDINKKQQRLAALRANTAGGNQTEIAQLEKEISDAQQQYGRTLEDQMLSEMQKQADEAAKQRQLQIDIAKQQLDWDKTTGVYARQVDTLIANLGTGKGRDAIQKLLQGNEEKVETYWSGKIKSQDLKTEIANATNAQSGIAGIKALLKDKDFKKALNYVIKEDDEFKNKQDNANKVNQITTRSEAEAAVASAKGRVSTAENNLRLVETSGNKSQINAARVELAHANAELTIAENQLANLKANSHAQGYLSRLPEKALTDKKDISNLQKGLNSLIDDGFFPGMKKLGTKGTYGNATRAAVLELQKQLNISGAKGNWDPTTAKKLKKSSTFKYYKTGGLADFTGPAWLDGTSSRPELVLNAQDTKNFIALKDILSDVMRGVSHIDSTTNYDAPTEFNINVNVDKITSDYDVDKLTERIKKNIVKDASYRNVTQVRNFR